MEKCPNCYGEFDEFEAVRCPLCGYVLKKDIASNAPNKYFLPEYAKSYLANISSGSTGFKVLGCLFGLLLFAELAYAVNAYTTYGYNYLVDWLFDEAGIFGILFMLIITVGSFLIGSGGSFFKSWKTKLNTIREFLNKGGL